MVATITACKGDSNEDARSDESKLAEQKPGSAIRSWPREQSPAERKIAGAENMTASKRWQKQVLVALSLLCGLPTIVHSTEQVAPVTSLERTALFQYAEALVAAHSDLLLGHSVPEKTLSQPAAYLVTFTIKRQAWLTKPLKFAGDRATQASNLQITEAWEKLFCTNELIALVKKHSIGFVNGLIVDERGSSHSLAGCFGSSNGRPLGDRTRIQ